MAAKLALERIPGFSPISRNFEALQNFVNQLAGNLSTTETVGPMVGSGASVANGAGTFVTLTGLVLTYTTPNRATRAEITVAARLISVTAAWAPAYFGLNVSPTPTSRLHGNASGTFNNDQIVDLRYTHSGGPVVADLQGVDTMLLAPNTTYTFQAVCAGGGVANGIKWDSGGKESWMKGVFWPEPA